ncbi:SURF1 family protein [Cobetia sp. 14N.309.X.WAT.E.A4]|uniref:SURF1 family protein n=1 Tax=Cobetia sp. 14N.309.X.WAT.E.A4 TaxID=2998323 RepID=UPI0025AF0567|nr:SURF1 family protein [Cobetia sp. 14N.309.X.WAT.E.A4]MDN2655139.1 SURF1 family protein [Cobetia sp. 14N.309.X.WAT.E.A4]
MSPPGAQTLSGEGKALARPVSDSRAHPTDKRKSAVTALASPEAPQERCVGRGWWLFWGCLIVLGLCLCSWQVMRGQARAQHLEDTASAPELVMPTAPPASASLIELQGEWLAEHSLLLDNRTLDKRHGVAVLTPFRSRDGRWWLVERGFVASPAPRADPEFITPEGSLVIRGRWQWLNGQGTSGGPLFGPNREGQRLQQVDLSAWKTLGAPAFAGIVHQTGGAGRFLPWWQPSNMTPERHYAYALQWLGLSLGAAVVMIVGARRQRQAALRQRQV